MTITRNENDTTPSTKMTTTTTPTPTPTPREYYEALEKKEKERFHRFVFKITTTTTDSTTTNSSSPLQDFVDLFHNHPPLAKLYNQNDLGLSNSLHPAHVAVFHYGRMDGIFELIKTIHDADPDGTKCIRTSSIGFQELVPMVGAPAGSTTITTNDNNDDASSLRIGWTPLEIAILEKNYELLDYMGRIMFKTFADFEESGCAPCVLFASIMSKNVVLASQIANKVPRAIMGDVTMKKRSLYISGGNYANTQKKNTDVDISPLSYLFSLPEETKEICDILQSFLHELEQLGEGIWQSLKLQHDGGDISSNKAINKTTAGKKKGKILGEALSRHENVSVDAENWTSVGLNTFLSTMASSSSNIKKLKLYIPKSLHADLLVQVGLSKLIMSSSSLETLCFELRYGESNCSLFDSLASVLPTTEEDDEETRKTPLTLVLSRGHVYGSDGFKKLLCKTQRLQFDSVVFCNHSSKMLVTELGYGPTTMTLEDVSFNFCRAEKECIDACCSMLLPPKEDIVPRSLQRLSVYYSDSLLPALGMLWNDDDDDNNTNTFKVVSFHLTLLFSKVSNESLRKILSCTYLDATLDFGFVANNDLHHLSQAIRDCTNLSQLTVKVSSHMELPDNACDDLFEATKSVLEKSKCLRRIDFQGLGALSSSSSPQQWSNRQWSKLQYLICCNRAGLYQMNSHSFQSELLATVLGRVSSSLSGHGLSTTTSSSSSCSSGGIGGGIISNNSTMSSSCPLDCSCITVMDFQKIRSSILYEMLRNHPSIIPTTKAQNEQQGAMVSTKDWYYSRNNYMIPKLIIRGFLLILWYFLYKRLYIG